MAVGFLREQLNVPPEPDPLFGLAMEYHDLCERYDRAVCSGSRNGVAMPMNGRESGLINRNALHERQRLRQHAAELLQMDEESAELGSRWQQAIVTASSEYSRQIRSSIIPELRGRCLCEVQGCLPGQCPSNPVK